MCKTLQRNRYLTNAATICMEESGRCEGRLEKKKNIHGWAAGLPAAVRRTHAAKATAPLDFVQDYTLIGKHAR